jgi:hypothetical protein
MASHVTLVIYFKRHRNYYVVVILVMLSPFGNTNTISSVDESQLYGGVMNEATLEFLKNLVQYEGACRVMRNEIYNGKLPYPIECGTSACPVKALLRKNGSSCQNSPIYAAAQTLLSKGRCLSIWGEM